MASIETIAAVLSSYMTIWLRVVDERIVFETYTCTDDHGFRMSRASFDSLCDKLREQLQRNARVR